jgi:transcriptional regulator GlxA family with amidase domain
VKLPLQVAIVVFDGVDELDALGPFEVLRNATAAGADINAHLVSLDGAEEVTGSHGLRFRVDGRLRGERPDVLIVPGGGWNDRGARGAWAEAQRGTLPEAIARLHSAGTTIASVCTGAMLVASAGLLAGRRAITHQGALADLEQAGAQVTAARVVDDGDILSAGGVTAGLDLAMWLVERHAGAAIAALVSTEMEYTPSGDVASA